MKFWGLKPISIFELAPGVLPLNMSENFGRGDHKQGA